jgi:transcriptional regulator with XRE-family HTH domain
MSKIMSELALARKALGLTQEIEAKKAGLNRMTVQKIEAGAIDPRLSTLDVLAHALGMEIMLVPKALRPSLENFVRSGGKYLGQPVGIDAPLSIVDELINSTKKNLKSK